MVRKPILASDEPKEDVSIEQQPHYSKSLNTSSGSGASKSSGTTNVPRARPNGRGRLTSSMGLISAIGRSRSVTTTVSPSTTRWMMASGFSLISSTVTFIVDHLTKPRPSFSSAGGERRSALDLSRRDCTTHGCGTSHAVFAWWVEMDRSSRPLAASIGAAKRPPFEFRLTDLWLSCTAGAHVPKPMRHGTRLHVRRAMRVACRREDFDYARQLGCRAEAGPCQLLPRVRRRQDRFCIRRFQVSPTFIFDVSTTAR